ncbi:MAG: FecR domain-containing protein [Pseudomonadota bacterium]|nr:FecR domain-containing protein [Pseudomonadota bacterium]
MTDRHSPAASVIDQASAWVVRLDGEVSEADYEALEAWLAQSPDHRRAFDEAEGLWAVIDEDRAALDAALGRATLRSPGTARTARPPSVRRRWLWAAGGAVAAALIAAVMILPTLPRTQTWVTAPGEQRTVTLSDGSTITMNGGSTLSVRMSRQERFVEMAEAEAAFDIAHDAERPFQVTVGQSRVEVLGTAFDIRRDTNRTRINVTRGVVRVSDLDDASHQVRLTKGQAVTRTDASGALEVTAGRTEPPGWRTGQLTYDNRPVSEVVADLNRAYPTPVMAVGGADRIRFTGVLVLDDQASVLRRIEAFAPVVAERRGDRIELRPR